LSNNGATQDHPLDEARANVTI